MNNSAGEEAVMMSFTDVLTCVFGAAILIFLVFAILVVFEPLGAEQIGDESGTTNRDLRSIQDALLEGYASSTLRFLTPNPALQNALEIEGLPVDADRLPVRVESRGRVYEGEQVEFVDNIGRLSLRLRAASLLDWSRIGQSDLIVALAVGGVVNCLRIPVSQPIWESAGGGTLVEIVPEQLGFLHSNLGSGACDDS